MAIPTCEVIWLHSLLSDFGFSQSLPTSLYYNNHAGFHIAANPVYRECTKHIEIDAHYL